MAGALLMEISQDERERARIRSRRMYETDQMSNILTAEARGRDLEAQEMIRNMKNQGISIEVIAKAAPRYSTAEIEEM